MSDDGTDRYNTADCIVAILLHDMHALYAYNALYGRMRARRGALNVRVNNVLKTLFIWVSMRATNNEQNLIYTRRTLSKIARFCLSENRAVCPKT